MIAVALAALLACILGCVLALVVAGREHRDRVIARRLSAMRFRPEREGW